MKQSKTFSKNNFKTIQKKRSGIHMAVLLLFFLFSVYITFPLIFNIGNLATGIGDELVMAWIHNWVIHAVLTNPIGLFEANLYYPYHNTLAFADSLISTSLLALPIQIVLKDPIVVVNFTFISALVLLGFSIYLLSYYITKHHLPALLAGVLVIFSPASLGFATHLQNLAVAWIPLAILAFLHFINTKKTKFFILSLLFFLMQLHNSFMPAYFIVVSFVIIVLYEFFQDKKRILKLINRKHVGLVALTCLLIIPVTLPYFMVSKEFNVVRDIRDAIHFAVQPEDLLYPTSHTRLNSFFLSLPFNQNSQNNEFKGAYVGFVFSILTIIAFVYFIKTIRRGNYQLKMFTTIGLTGLVLSLGPVLHLGRQTIHEPFPIPLPYALFYYILPGFQGFRNSARWEMLFIIAMAIAIAIVIAMLLQRFSFKKQLIIYLMLILGCIAEFNFPMKFVEVPQRKDFPKVDYWLTTTPSTSVLLHMPIYNWGSWPFTQQEIYREYYSTLHFRKMINGYTSYSPPQWQKFIATMDNEFPSDKSIKIIRDMGVDYLIVHKDLYDQGFQVKQQKYTGGEVLKMLNDNSLLSQVQGFDAVFVYKFVEK